MQTRPFTRLVLLAAAALLGASPSFAQAPPAAPTVDVSMAPIECYWRASAAAVRVGQVFDVVLTCGVLDTAATTVVPDESRLDPDVVQLQPFEVIGGTTAAEVRTAVRRFVQYTYRVRYIGEDIGKDVPLPALTLTYRVQSRVQDDAAAVESRERQYILPARPIRVLSLLPGGSQDIRDVPPATFDAIASRRFTANVLRIASSAIFALAAILAIWALVRGTRRRRGRHPVLVKLASDRAILNAAAREIAAVQGERNASGWTDTLAARALTPLRIAASYEVGRPVAQTPVDRAVMPTSGQLRVARPWPRMGAVILSASGTSTHLGLERQRAGATAYGRTQRLESLDSAIARFSAAAYGRDHATPDESALDEALTTGMAAVHTLRREHGWLATTLRAAVRSADALRARAWAR